MKRLKILFAGIFLFSIGFCGLLIKKDVVSVSVAEEQSTSQVESSEPISSEFLNKSEDPETIVTKATGWIENKVIPLLGGFSIANLVGIVVAVVTALTKHRGDKALTREINVQSATIENVTFRVNALNAEVKEKLKQISDAYEKAYMVMVKANEAFDEIAKIAVDQNVNIKKVEEMKLALNTACDLMAKSISLSDAAVKSGIAEQALQLIANMQGGNSDGGTQ